MRTITISLLLVLFFMTPAFPREAKVKPVRKTDILAAIEYIKKPAEAIDNMGWEQQVYYRLENLRRETGYTYQESDAAQWKLLMQDTKASMYPRLCAAYFLSGDDKDARQFIETQLRSDNLRYRFNAARALEMFAGTSKGAAKEWAVDLLIKLLENRTLEIHINYDAHNHLKGNSPENDRDDDILTPIDRICIRLGFLKEKQAVPVLISLVNRRVCPDDAAYALANIGALEAAPALLELLKSKEFVLNEHMVVDALAEFKYRPAAPVLAAKLLTPPQANDQYTTERILDALLEIGDPSVVGDIEKYLQGDIPQDLRSAARRVLVQFKEKDPVPSLINLLDNETNKYSRTEIILDLARHKDGRVVKKFSELARNSDSASARSHAIWGLERMGGREALLELASLLDVKFPKDLKADIETKGNPPSDFSKYFPEQVARCLQVETKQDFGTDSQKWRQWLQANLRE